MIELADKLQRVGLRGFMQIGRMGQVLFEIPVSEGRVGAVVIGGLNPIYLRKRVCGLTLVQWLDWWISISCSVMRNWKAGCMLIFEKQGLYYAEISSNLTIV